MDEFIFQQDGAPAHKAEIIDEFFEAKGITVLDWAAKSPDINVIEHLWAICKRQISDQRFQSVEELKEKYEKYGQKSMINFVKCCNEDDKKNRSCY